MQPNKVTTNNIPKEYQTAQLNNYVGALQQPATLTPPATLPTQAISAQAISNPPAPIQLPNVDTTATTNMANEIASGAQSKFDADILNAQQEAAKIQASAGNGADTARKSMLDSVKSLLDKRTGALEGQVTMEEQMGLSKEVMAKNEINTEIANTQVELRREQDRIRTTGMSKGQAQVENGVIADTYGRRLADLAIRQSAATGNIEAIKSDADRKTKLLLGAIDNDISYFKDFESQNIDALEKKEKEKLSLIVNNLEQKKKDTEALEKAKTEMLMEISANGGGTNTALVKNIQNAESIGDVYGIASGSGLIGKLKRDEMALDRQVKQASIAKIYADMANDSAGGGGVNIDGLRSLSTADNAKLNATPQAKELSSGVQYAAAVKAYKNAIVKYGTGEVLNGVGSGVLASAYQNLVGATKDYYKLGTLDNGVEKLVNIGIKKPSVWGRSSFRKSALDTELNAVANNLETQAKQLESTAFSDSIEAQTMIGTARAVKQLEEADPLEIGISGTPTTVNSNPLGI